jgi:hypothetical protein
VPESTHRIESAAVLLNLRLAISLREEQRKLTDL